MTVLRYSKPRGGSSVSLSPFTRLCTQSPLYQFFALESTIAVGGKGRKMFLVAKYFFLSFRFVPKKCWITAHEQKTTKVDISVSQHDKRSAELGPFEIPQRFYLNTEMVLKRGFSVFWRWSYREFLAYLTEFGKIWEIHSVPQNALKILCIP